MQAHAHEPRTGMVADPSLPYNAGGPDTQPRAATLQEAARSAAMRQLIARSVLHGPALRSLLAAGR